MCVLASPFTMGGVLWKMNGSVFFFSFCVCWSKCQFKETCCWFLVEGQPIGLQTKAREHYSLLCHFKFISWMQQIKRYCSFRYYLLLMFNVSLAVHWIWACSLAWRELIREQFVIPVFTLEHLLIMLYDRSHPFFRWVYTCFNSQLALAFIYCWTSGLFKF